eukprot:scaffold220486_cov38-Prasinocladus_malaysianus.AAC.1
MPPGGMRAHLEDHGYERWGDGASGPCGEHLAGRGRRAEVRQRLRGDHLGLEEALEGKVCRRAAGYFASARKNASCNIIFAADLALGLLAH